MVLAGASPAHATGDVARATATTTATKAEGNATPAHARLHVPSLPLLSLIEIEQVISTATCEVGRKPVATTDLPGSVTVLGKRVKLTAGGPTDVTVPGVGAVRLDLSNARTTARSPWPRRPARPPAPRPKPPTRPPTPSPRAPAEANLAETGGSSATPYLVGGRWRCWPGAAERCSRRG
ncbi:LAETG motif-containing sortase-dependent surface protein [Streptomyces olindensis]|uniref:LAETG motif-containing sortase-dependent surface protein n=1 Tax=Streptomyces olindensis TaxID=358823 RepID=UPI003655E16E